MSTKINEKKGYAKTEEHRRKIGEGVKRAWARKLGREETARAKSKI